VASYFGPQFGGCGYDLAAAGLFPGRYQVVVYAHSTVSGVFTAAIADIIVRPPGDPLMAIDSPGQTTTTTPFDVAGWAVDRDATSGTGVDTVHVWAYPLSGDSPIFLGVAAYGGGRPDVDAALGGQGRFVNAGFGLTVSSVAVGDYDVVVYAHSTVTNSFGNARSVRVRIR
jgi:hypothetical protein